MMRGPKNTQNERQTVKAALRAEIGSKKIDTKRCGCELESKKAASRLGIYERPEWSTRKRLL